MKFLWYPIIFLFNSLSWIFFLAAKSSENITPPRWTLFLEIVMQIQILQPSEGICDKSETGTATSSQAIVLIKVLCFKTEFNQG